MTFDNLWEIFSEEIPNRIVKHKGLSQFAKNRSKFEGWLKVEIIDILINHTDSPIPEKDKIDVVFTDWAIELKTSNTRYKDENAIDKKRPLSKNIKSIIGDIDSLKANESYKNRAVLFIAFPLELPNDSWVGYIQKIENKLEKLRHKEFNFGNGVKAVLYFGLVR